MPCRGEAAHIQQCLLFSSESVNNRSVDYSSMRMLWLEEVPVVQHFLVIALAKMLLGFLRASYPHPVWVC